MSSPIGGFYLSAQQRHKRKLAEYDARVAMMLNLTLTDKREQSGSLIALNEKIYIGAEYQFGSETLLNLTSTQLESGLLQVSFDYKQSRQTLTLGPNEPISSQLADNKNINIFLVLSTIQD